MEIIPSTIVLHKRMDGTDVRLASMDGPTSHSPIANDLGITTFGTYKRAASHHDHAFVQLKDIWDDEVTMVDSSDEEDPEVENNINTLHESEVNDSSEAIEEPKQVINDNKTSIGRIIKRNPNRKLELLYRMIDSSRDKLLFISRLELGREKKTWYLVQVDWEETNPEKAKRTGLYHCRWFIRHFEDSKTRQIKECRYWPEIHEIINDVLGAMVLVRPSRVNNMLQKRKLKYAWYQQEVNLTTELLVGPFNFQPTTTTHREPFRISNARWNKLKQHHKTVAIENMDQIIPVITKK